MTRPPRQLVLGMGWFPDQPGGLNRYLRGLVDGMAAAAPGKVRLVVIGPAVDPPPGARVVASHDTPLPLRLARFALAARREARGAELVDVHFALYAFPSFLLRLVRRPPLVVHFHGPWADEFIANGEKPGAKTDVRRWLERRVYRRAAAFVVLSEAFKAILVTDFGISPADVHVLGAGVDLDRFSPGDRAEARTLLGLAESAPVAVCARRLVARMGLDVLVRAWAALDDPARVLLVVGEGPDLPALEALAAELGIERHVRFLGRVSDTTLVSCYRAADVSIVPSVALEGFGLVVLEALACGTAVVASDVGGLREALAPLDPTLLVPPGDPAALTARLRDAVSGGLPSPDACRSFAESFSWRAVADRHLVLYADLLARRAR